MNVGGLDTTQLGEADATFDSSDGIPVFCSTSYLPWYLWYGEVLFCSVRKIPPEAVFCQYGAVLVSPVHPVIAETERGCRVPAEPPTPPSEPSDRLTRPIHQPKQSRQLPLLRNSAVHRIPLLLLFVLSFFLVQDSWRKTRISASVQPVRDATPDREVLLRRGKERDQDGGSCISQCCLQVCISFSQSKPGYLVSHICAVPPSSRQTQTHTYYTSHY